MNKKIIVCLLIFVFLLSNQVFAEIFIQAFLTKTGSQLLERLKEPQSEKDYVYYIYEMGFLEGVVGQYVLLTEAGVLKKPKKPVCLPLKELTLNQIRLVVVKWLENHPENLHQPVTPYIFVALGEAFPCKK